MEIWRRCGHEFEPDYMGATNAPCPRCRKGLILYNYSSQLKYGHEDTYRRIAPRKFKLKK